MCYMASTNIHSLRDLPNNPTIWRATVTLAPKPGNAADD